MSSKKYSRNSFIMILEAPTVILTLKLAHKSFCMTLRLMMMHHQIKVGHKRFSGSRDIGWTNIH